MRLLVLPVLAATILAGCATPFSGPLGPREGFMDGFMEGWEAMEPWPVLSPGELRVEPRYDPVTQEASVTVRGSVLANRTENLHVDVVLGAEPCARLGPPGRPDAVADERLVRLADPVVLERLSYQVVLVGHVLPGTEFSVYVRPAADNALGPIFGECRTFRAL